MDTAKISEDINHRRRRFLGAAAVTLAAAELGRAGFANAQAGETKSADLPAIKPGTNTTFAPLKQIDAGLLNVGYAEAGPPTVPAVVLLHGWPYDIYSFVDVAPLLASAGYRVIIPYLRGYGSTRFPSSETVRNGQPSVVAVDAIALMDALKIERATIAGFDWGGRTADIIAALWPERCQGPCFGERLSDRQPGIGKVPLPPAAEAAWRYQFYFAQNAAAPATTNTGATFRSSSGGSPRRSGALTTRRSIARRRRSKIRIMSPSSSITIAGGKDWLKANRNTTIWKSGLPKVRSSPCRPSPWKATPTARRIRSLALRQEIRRQR